MIHAYDYRRLLTYGLISVVVTVIDVLLVRRLFLASTPLMVANAAGTVTGSFVQFVLNALFTFHNRMTLKNLIYHFSTMLLGLLVGNGVIWISYHVMMGSFSEVISFYVSKGLAIVVPFFVMYALRVRLLGGQNEI